MNKRIKQLLSKCNYVTDGTCDLSREEKFAMLIIEDCIDCVDGYTKPRTFDTHYDAVEQIKHLFGIE
jgi:hypothetical protein